MKDTSILSRGACTIKAVPFLLSSGEWVPHVFSDTEEPAIIISTDTGFRVSRDLRHGPGETVHKNAVLIRSRCIYCGKEELSWREAG